MSKSRNVKSKRSTKSLPTPKPKAVSTRAGSHAGRGFRYQDAAAAWLAVQCWNGNISYGGVTPEGRDDAELNGPTGTTFVQMKSRREHLGSYLPGDVAGFVRDLWGRASKASSAPADLLLVIERPVADVPLENGVPAKLSASDRIGKLLATDSRAKVWMPRTKIVVAASPSEMGAALIGSRAGSHRLVASIAFAAITSAIGRLSDDNGQKAPGSFVSLSTSDITRLVDDLTSVMASTDLEAAISDGLCEAVDFLTPTPSQDFYLGMDVQPGHLAAGLLVERPAARERVLNTLEARRTVLIVGPSGSGKSGLMWQAARESRHTVRWFRVRAARVEDVPKLLRLTVTHRASEHAPIGFIIDDVGRTRAGLWDELAAEAAARPGVVLLGSLREEDMFLVERRTLSADLHEPPGEEMAELLWRALTERGQTEQPGWREPWREANGLLLEYAYLLTQGRRLDDVLREQAERRARESRTRELAILRIASVIGRTGGTTDLSALQTLTGSSPDELSLALRRLVDEHLLQTTSDGKLSSLHQIRANALAAVTHEAPPPTFAETVRIGFAAVSREDIESYVARSMTMPLDVSDALVAGAVDRWQAAPGLPLLSSILRGFAAGDISRTIDQWIASIADLNLAKTQITQALMYALANTTPFLTDRLQAHFDAADRFRALPRIDHRVAVLDIIGGEVAGLLAHEPAWSDVVEFLTACTSQALPAVVIEALRALKPSLAGMPAAELVGLLEAVNLHDPQLAEAWVSDTGQDVLLTVMSGAAPWRSAVKLQVEPEGLAVMGKLLHISDEVQGDLHGEVVEMCQQALALAPTADVAVFQAIDPDGYETGIGGPIASKRILRANLHASPVPLRNRQWMRAAAQTIAPSSRSQFLARAAALLETLLPPLQRLIDKIIRHQVRRDDVDLITIGSVHEQTYSLTQPPRVGLNGDDQGVFGLADIQNVLFTTSADLVRWIDRPEDLGIQGYANIQELIAQIDKAAAEPWDLIGEGPPAALLGLRKLLVDIAPVIGEAASRGMPIAGISPATVIRARPGRALSVLLPAVTVQIGAARNRLKAALQAALKDIDPGVAIHIRPVSEVLGRWPYSESIIIMNIADPADWAERLQQAEGIARETLGEGARLTLMPAINGRSVPIWAVSSIGLLLPAPFEDTAWLSSVGRPPLELPLTQTVDAAFGALLTLSAIQAFDCATPGRHPDEAATRLEYETRLRVATTKLREGLTGDLLEEADAVLTMLMDEEGELSVAFYGQLRGASPSAAFERYVAFKNAVTAIELSPDTTA
ncbi:hypothetical protein [Brevundimonas sp.]|uniref:hypothetical protein n=1 Tax=Brevundimonas sp. TaxID=1871086 RepID=UPI00289CB67F|nr:hypothetical protein [Brevundimonas sp.]